MFPGCATRPRDIIVSDVRDPSGMGKFRHDQKPSSTLYWLYAAGSYIWC